MKNINCNAIRADLEKQRKQRKRKKQRQDVRFKKKYDKPNVFNFPSIDEVNMDRHFYFPKIFNPGAFGSNMSKAAIAVYPVMCSRANFEHNDWFQISQENIAKMAGVSEPTVSEGVKHLVDNKYVMTTTDEAENNITIPLLERKMTTEGTRHFYLYRAGFIRKDMIHLWKGQYFLFYTCLIDSGIWANLLPRAKALYLAMRSNAKQDYQLYRDVEEENGWEWMTSYEDYLQMRKWDVCITPLAELARRVNVDVSDSKNVLQQLEHCKLVERVDRWFKVYLKPKIRRERKIPLTENLYE
jgi:hypothetical protein